MAMAYKTRNTTSTTQLGKLVDGLPIVPLTAAYLALSSWNSHGGLILPLGMYHLIQQDRMPKAKQTVNISGKGLLNDLALWGVVWFTLMRGASVWAADWEAARAPVSGASFDQAYGRQT